MKCDVVKVSVCNFEKKAPWCHPQWTLVERRNFISRRFKRRRKMLKHSWVPRATIATYSDKIVDVKWIFTSDHKTMYERPEKTASNERRKMFIVKRVYATLYRWCIMCWQLFVLISRNVHHRWVIWVATLCLRVINFLKNRVINEKWNEENAHI